MKVFFRMSFHIISKMKSEMKSTFFIMHSEFERKILMIWFSPSIFLYILLIEIGLLELKTNCKNLVLCSIKYSHFHTQLVTI